MDSMAQPASTHTLFFGRGINEYGGYFGVIARDCKIRGSKAAAGNLLATPGELLQKFCAVLMLHNHGDLGNVVHLSLTAKYKSILGVTQPLQFCSPQLS